MRFSKRDTSVVKGVAILFLIAFHCFSSPDRLYGAVSFYPLSQKTAMYIFETMNICVGMFAFLSSYGLTKTLKSDYPTLRLDAQIHVTFATKRVISALSAFFLPYVLCTAATFAFVDYNPYGKGATFVCNVLMDMFGLAGLLHTPTLVGTWWYMSFALVIIFLTPFTVEMYKKFGLLAIIPYAVLPVLFVPEFRSGVYLTNMTRWLLTIPLGIIFADADLFEKLKSGNICKNRALSKMIKFIVLTAMLFLLIKLRTSNWGTRNFYYYISSILPIYYIYYLYEFITDIPIVNTILAFFGKHSSNIFFTHTFIRVLWFKELTYSFHYAILIFAFMIICSLAMSFAIEGLKKLIRWNHIIKILTDKLIVLENKLF